MPPHFEFNVNVNDAIVHIGAHTMDPATIPADPTTWIEPSYVLINQNDKIVCVEPIVPFRFAIGDKDQLSNQELVNVDQTDMSLPDRLSRNIR